MGAPIAIAAPTVAEYAEAWLPLVAAQVRPRTHETYASQFRLHILPAIGPIPLDELDVDDILKFIDRLRAAGYTGWSIRTALGPLSRMLNHAVRRGVVNVNPVTRLDRRERPAVSEAEQRFLNRDEIARLLDAAPPRFRVLLATAVFTGLRQSELLALRWSDIDFDGGVVRVRRALDRHGSPQETKTRNAVRDVVLIPALARMLHEHRRCSSYVRAADFVFASLKGTPLHWRNISRRALHPALDRAQLGQLRWHDLRHTFAALLIAEGVNIIYVSRQLGHGSPEVTLKCYGHIFERSEYADRTRAALEASVGGLLELRK